MGAIRKKAGKMGLTATPTPVTTNRCTALATTKGRSKKATSGDLIKKENDVDQEENLVPTNSSSDEINGSLNDRNTQLSTPPKTLCNQDTITVNTEDDVLTPATKTASSAATNKVIAGRVTKNRASPRKLSKTDYAHLDDPFATIDADTDGDGEKVFGDAPSSSEDSAAEDDAFEGDEVEEDVPMEV